MTTCSSLLLSNGSIFTRTNPRGTSATEIKKQIPHCDKEQEAIARGANQRRHDAAIEPGPPVLGLRFQQLGSFQMLAEQAQRSPGRNHKGNHQREEHGRRSTDGNGPHVGSHQAAHKGHGQHRGDHGEGGQNGWIADLGDCLDRNFAHRAAVIFRQSEVAHHVLDDNNGVVDENADTEDQCEQRDAVDGVAERSRTPTW